MDPDETLKMAISELADGNRDDAISDLYNLQEWLRRGGFIPNAKKYAAAPEMYDVLRQIQSLRDRANSDEGFSDDEGEDVEQAMDAILAKIDNA